MFQQVKTQDEIDKLVKEFVAVQAQLKAKSELEDKGVTALNKENLKKQAAIVAQLKKGTAELLGQLTPIQQVLGTVSAELTAQGVAQPSIVSILTNLSSKSNTSNELMRNLSSELIAQGASLTDVTQFIKNIQSTAQPNDVLSAAEELDNELNNELDFIISSLDNQEQLIGELTDKEAIEILREKIDKNISNMKLLRQTIKDNADTIDNLQQIVIGKTTTGEDIEFIETVTNTPPPLTSPPLTPPVLVPGLKLGTADIPGTVEPPIQLQGVASGPAIMFIQPKTEGQFKFDNTPGFNIVSDLDSNTVTITGPNIRKPIKLIPALSQIFLSNLKNRNTFNVDTVSELARNQSDTLSSIFRLLSPSTRRSIENGTFDTTPNGKIITQLFKEIQRGGQGIHIPVKKSRGKPALKNNIGKMQRHQYKITAGNGIASFGKVEVDLPQLQNYMRLIAKKDNEIILDEDIDQDTFDILTKRCKRGCNYTQDAVRVFRKMVKFGELPISPTSKKFALLKEKQRKGVKIRAAKPRKKKGGVVRPTKVKPAKPKVQAPIIPIAVTVDDMIARLGLLTSGLSTGNNSPLIKNEIASIADELLTKGVITQVAHKQIYTKYGLA